MCTADPNPANCMANMSGNVWGDVVTAVMVLVPLVIIVMAMMKVSDNRESAGAFLIETVMKAGGAFVAILLIREVFGI